MGQCSEGMPNKALQQNRDDVLRYGESIGCDLLKAAVLLLRTRPPLHHRVQAIDKPRAIVVRFIALLLIGTTLHFLFSLIAVNFGDHWWLENPRWGVYAAEYIAFAAWLAWGPPAALCRIAVVTLLGISWMLGTWAGLWAADPMYRRGFGGERLGVFTLAPLALVLGTLPLAAMRTWFRLVAPLSRSSRNNSANVVSILTVACVGAVIIAAHRVRGPDLHWDIWIAAQIAIILGVIAAATAPLLAWGFLRGEVRPIPILKDRTVNGTFENLAPARNRPTVGFGSLLTLCRGLTRLMNGRKG